MTINYNNFHIDILILNEVNTKSCKTVHFSNETRSSYFYFEWKINMVHKFSLFFLSKPFHFLNSVILGERSYAFLHPELEIG